MIHEITGQPGHGKTLYGLVRAREFAKEGRSVYVNGVRGLNYGSTGFLPLDDPKEWESLPDNSVIVLDECYSTFPNRNAASAVPPYIEALARHRHRGFDFILIHQQPNQVDPFVRGLVDTHTHVRRKFGMEAAVLKEWDHSTSNPIKDTPLRKPLWKYPKDVYQLYESATMHTVKRRLPWQLFAAVPIAAYVIWAFLGLTDGTVIDSDIPAAQATAGAPANAGVFAGVGAQQFRGDYEDWMKPRTAGITWTAPAFDNLRAQAHPELYCAVSGAGLGADGRMYAGGCTCLTEQGTRAEVPRADCERFAVDGIYNPFKRVEQDRNQRNTRAQPLAADRAAATVSTAEGAR